MGKCKAIVRAKLPETRVTMERPKSSTSMLIPVGSAIRQVMVVPEAWFMDDVPSQISILSNCQVVHRGSCI